MIVHYPQEGELRRELSKRVAGVYAQVVTEKIKGLSCPVEQKIALLDRILTWVEAQPEEEGGPL